MTIEHFPGRSVFEDTILTVNEVGEEVYVPISQISELKQDPYHWGDAMTVTFDDNEGDNDD